MTWMAVWIFGGFAALPIQQDFLPLLLDKDRYHAQALPLDEQPELRQAYDVMVDLAPSIGASKREKLVFYESIQLLLAAELARREGYPQVALRLAAAAEEVAEEGRLGQVDALRADRSVASFVNKAHWGLADRDAVVAAPRYWSTYIWTTLGMPPTYR